MPPTKKTTDNTLPDRFLTAGELAAMLQVPVQTIYQWRYLGSGPPGFRVGKHLRYDPVAVRHWIDQRTTEEAA